MSQIVIFAEKPDIGTRLAATLGGCYINGTEFKPDMISDKKYESLIKRERSSKGFFKCSSKGFDYLITWGFGHIAELKQAKDYDAKYNKWDENLFPFVPEKYEIKLKDDSSIRNHFNLIKKLFTDPSTEYIINATDADREGELIFDYTYRLTGSRKPYKRLWVNSYTEEAIEEGFSKLKSLNEIIPLQNAGRCRAISDWLVGSNFTVEATLKFGGYKNMVSIGRVQTPTLAILVNRELEILNFKSEEYFELIGTFKTKKNELYQGKWKNKKNDRFNSKKDADVILKKIQKANGKIVKYEENPSKEQPPLLYDLTSLQMDANSKYGFSAQQTLDTVQKLYENQILTYPRTNSRYLSEDTKPQIKRIIGAMPDAFNPYKDKLSASNLTYTKRVFDNSKVESHGAIITTYKAPKGLTPDEQKIYDMVAKSLLKAFMENAIWSNTKIETDVNGETFYSSGKTLVKAGWRAVDGKIVKNAGDSDQLLPIMKQDDTVITQKLDVIRKQTKAPGRYTEKTLLSAMETAGKFVEDDELREAMKDHGLGTPATRASTIERLIQVGYIKREKKNLVPTDKGIEVIKILPIESIKSPSMTGDWEFKLNQIERGKLNSDLFLNEITKFTVETVNALKQYEKKEIISAVDSLGKCPNCSSPVVKNKKGYGCSNWKNGCKFQIWDNEICGKKLSKSNIKQLLEKGVTNEIKDFKSPKSGKQFNAKMELIKDGNGKLNFKF